MEWKSNLSTTVSCDQPTWIQTGLQNRKTTVSQLVARYQITNVSSGIQENVEKKEEAKPKQIPQALLETKESQLEALGRRNDKKDQSPERTSLVRSKSMGSLQSNNGSIEARKARFESKAAAENKAKSSFGAKRNQSSNKMADIDQVVNGEVEEMSQALLESKESHADTLRRGNGAKDQSPDKTSLVRSKSMASLQSNAGSIEARMFQFESKAAAQNSVKTNKQSPKKSTDITQLMNGDAEQISQSPPESKEAHLEASGKRNEEKEQSWVKTSLVHAKSMGSPQSNAGSIEALMARFESKAAAQNKVKRVLNIQPSSKSKDVVQNIQGETEDIKNPREKRKTHMAVNASVDEGKKDPTSQKVANRTRRERRKTIGGIDFEKMVASLIDEKRRSLVDFRDKETLSVSVKAISALYLSKVAPQEPTNRLSKPAHDQSSRSGRTVKLFKFQPACQETCSACLKPVYTMEKITANKFIFHKSCFYCKLCKKKLSVYNYAPLHGEFYCIFHYQQLLRRKGNYDEGFGRTQHKNQSLQRESADTPSNKPEA